MSLEKDLQQEDYLQGRMQGNPYSSKEPGLGPLMRDVKNKICIGNNIPFVYVYSIEMRHLQNTFFNLARSIGWSCWDPLGSEVKFLNLDEI